MYPSQFAQTKTESKQPIPRIPIVIYALGVLVGLGLAVIATWADVEANFYGFPRRANNALGGLRCPVILSRNETGVVSLRVSNPTDRTLSPSVKTEISTPILAESFLKSVRLAPGESSRLEWRVGPENIDLEYFIFVKVLVYAFYPIPDRETTCGTFIMDLPLSGSTFLSLMVTLSLTAMGIALYLLYRSRARIPQAAAVLPPLTFLALVIILAFVISFIGWWIQATVALVIAVLAIFILPAFVIARQR